MSSKKAKIMNVHNSRSGASIISRKISASVNDSSALKDIDSDRADSKIKRKTPGDLSMALPFPLEHSGLALNGSSVSMDTDCPPNLGTPCDEEFNENDFTVVELLKASNQYTGDNNVVSDSHRYSLLMIVGSDHLSIVI